MRTFLAVLLLSTLACTTTSTPPPDPAIRDIEAFLTSTVNTLDVVPSIGFAIVRDGVPYAGAVGYADIDKRTLADARTGYYIGSNTKAFTGLACAILAQQGKLDLDAPVTKYLPEVQFSPSLDTNKITLRRLLAHTSGIENDPIVFRTAFSGEHDRAALLALLASSRPRGSDAFKYNNLGYVVAGMVMERVTSLPWQQLHQSLVFAPLGMKASTASMSEAARGALAVPYDFVRPGRLAGAVLRKKDQTMHAAGGTVTTPQDLTRWLEANLNGGRIGARQVIPRAAIEETHRRQATLKQDRAFPSDAYGFGWYHATLKEHPLLIHGGGYEGWQAMFSFMPEEKIGVAVVTNSGLAEPVNAMVTSYIYERLLNAPDVEKTYAERLAKLKSEQDRAKARYAASIEERSKRMPTLMHERSAYVGRFENPLYGTLTIAQRGESLIASIGSLTSQLEAFTEPESARVELIPGSGEALRFTFSTAANADAVQWRGETFTRRADPSPGLGPPSPRSRGEGQAGPSPRARGEGARSADEGS